MIVFIPVLTDSLPSLYLLSHRVAPLLPRPSRCSLSQGIKFTDNVVAGPAYK